MEHDHNHHHHDHAPTKFGGRFAAAIALNVALVVLQFVFGIVANSVALIADAGHNLGDVLGLLLAWGAHVLATAQPTKTFTYGYRSAPILAALANGIILLVATGAIAWEAIQRLFEPHDVAGLIVMVVAAVGIVVNGVSAYLLMAGRNGDLNIRGAFLHLVGDAAVSLGVVLAGGLILLTGWHWLDPVASLAISCFIVWSTWGLLVSSIRLSLDAVPEGIDPHQVQRFLESLPGVVSVHDLHVWAMSTTETALTCHLVMPDGRPGDDFLLDVSSKLNDRFKIGHPTLQIECDDRPCKLTPDQVV